MSNISIKSSIKDYKVYFNDSALSTLEAEILHGDFLFIDKNVFNYMPRSLKRLISNYHHILIDATEKQKSYSSLKPLIQNLIKNSFRRNNRLIAIGGGITQDITAFIASITYRGVEWLFFPTTLLAQADSCIGGKTSINIGSYKNQLGNFYPPSKIFIITDFLKTLSISDFKSGMGEMLHFYLVSGDKDFLFYQKNYKKAFNNNKALISLIKKNLEIKKYFIELDEFDRKERLLLNYGHSFGHAIESLTNYKIPHGIAVSYGMDIANFISFKLNFISYASYKKIKSQLQLIWADIRLENINIKDFEGALSKDKKNINKSYQLILTKGVGKMVKYGINPNSEFTDWLNEYFEALKNESN